MFKNTNLFTRLIVLASLLALTGCSGGSGSGGGVTTVTIGSSSVSMVINNPSLQLGQTTTASATFKRADGTAAAGIPVTFSTTLGTVTPASGVATTDINGTASIQLTAGSTSGQGQLSANATVDNKLVTKTGLFSVSLPTLKLANLRFTNNSSATISFGSSQGISVEVLDANGNPYTAQPVDVVFTSTFSAQGKASINSSIVTVNGMAATTYTAITAAGTDSITASIAGYTKTVNLTVTPLSAGSISFVSAAPTNIGLKGMGGSGVQEASKVTFKVVDTSGAPKANQPVNFALNTTVGGLSLSTVSGSTGSDGTVSTIVQSGVIATPVRVTATTSVNGGTISTQSDQLVVSTGIPTQDGVSVSLSNLNPECWNTDGVIVGVTARLSDHFHNPVPDGTAVSFTTSGGAIQPSCVTTNGACTVNWTSQNFRPVNGRVRILAYAVGEESFTDLNGNGVCDATDLWTDDSEAYLDINENGVRDANEPFIDFNGDGVFNAGDGKYNGVLQGTAYIGAPKTKHVFLNTTLVMASSAANISFPSNAEPITQPGIFTFTVSDVNGNTMPSGTKVSVSAPFGVLSGNTSYIFPQSTGGGVQLKVLLAATASPKQQSGFLSITVTSPSGLITTRLVDVNGAF